MGKAIFYIVTIGIIWLIVCAIWPFWNRYGIESDLEAAAIYGTKHSIEDARQFLTQKAKERGYHFDPRNLDIEKDNYNTVSITLTYQDSIRFLTLVLKELKFTVSVTKREARAQF